MKPALLLMPGMLNDASLWSEVEPALRAVTDVRALPALVQDSVPAMAAAAWRALDDVPTATPVYLAGFSLGGYVALEMLAHPARAVAGTALISTSARPESAEGAVIREKTITALRADAGKVVDGIVAWGTHQAPPALTARLRDMMISVGAETAITQTRAIMGRADHRGALAHLTLPILVMCGRQDRITPPALSEELAALIAGAQLQWIEGAGHLLPAERPQAVAEAIAALIGRATTDNATRHNEGDML